MTETRTGSPARSPEAAAAAAARRAARRGTDVPGGPAPGSPAAGARRRSPLRTAVAALVVVFAALAVWGVLFSAFGTADGDGGRAKALRDSFDRPAVEQLGAPDSGPAWQVRSGSWGVSGGQAGVVSPAPGGLTTAVVPLGSKEVRIAATTALASPGWGLAFRARSATDFWYVVVADPAGSLHLGVAEHGVPTDLGATGATVSDGSRVEVRVDDARIDVYVDGRYVTTRHDDRLRRATDVGLFLQGTSAAPRWADVSGGPLPAPVIVVPPGQS